MRIIRNEGEGNSKQGSTNEYQEGGKSKQDSKWLTSYLINRLHSSRRLYEEQIKKPTSHFIGPRQSKGFVTSRFSASNIGLMKL